MKDQREVVHAYDYVANGNAGAGRIEKDCVTNNPWPATVDSHVKSVKRTFDDVGRMASVTCYSDNACTGGNERNVVQFTYDGWGSVIKSRQEHGGAVDANTPDVEYAYADGGEGDDTAEYVRLKCLEYPNGRRVHYTYPASGIGSMLSRLDEIVPDDGGSPDMTAGREYAQYTFLGAGTVVQVSHPAVDGGLTLSYKSASAGVYPGFDRFGRVRWQPWKKTDGTVLDRYFYGYDRAGNRTWRAERINPQDPGGRDEAYGYDSLHRLVKAQRGILTETGDELRAPVGGDVNNDGVIDANDYGEVDKGYLFGGDEWEEGDLNGDGVVDANDYDIIDYNYLHYPSRAVSRTGQWSLDALGNWPAYKEDAGPGDEDQGDWDLEQAREHNWVNEIDTDNNHANAPDADAITEGANQADWRSPVYNAVGNMTFAPRPSDEATDVEGLVMVYDRWNRLAAVYKDTGTEPGVKDAGDTLIAKYRYDALGRRIVKLVPNGETNWDRTDYYYNASWQCLEERTETVAGEATAAADVKVQYVWDLRYIDAPVLRWRDADGNSETGDYGLEETLYYCNDANMNVTALVDPDGDVVERYQYDPYGKPTFLKADWSLQEVDGEDDGEASAYANEILYCGYRYDPETGLYHVRYRMYHPTLGRWLQRDPIGYSGAMGLYEYAHSRSSSAVDPSGLRPDFVINASLEGGGGRWRLG